MAGQEPKPDFGQSKCPDCDAVMKPVSAAQGERRDGRSARVPEVWAPSRTDESLRAAYACRG